MRKLPVSATAEKSLTTERRAQERKVFVEERSKGLVSTSDILQRPDIVPKSLVEVHRNEGILKHCNLDEVESYRKLMEEYEQRYAEERNLRLFAENQVREMREKLCFYESMGRESSVLKTELEKLRRELEAERELHQETLNANAANAKELGRQIDDLEKLIATQQYAEKSNLATVEQLRIEAQSLRDELTFAKSDTQKFRKEAVSKTAEIAGELESLRKELEGERKSKRAMELMYAELFDTHQKCVPLSAEKAEFQRQIQDLETRLLREISNSKSVALENTEKLPVNDPSDGKQKTNRCTSAHKPTKTARAPCCRCRTVLTPHRQ